MKTTPLPDSISTSPAAHLAASQALADELRRAQFSRTSDVDLGSTRSRWTTTPRAGRILRALSRPSGASGRRTRARTT